MATSTKGMFCAATIYQRDKDKAAAAAKEKDIPVTLNTANDHLLVWVFIPNTMADYTQGVRQMLRDTGIEIFGEPRPRSIVA